MLLSLCEVSLYGTDAVIKFVSWGMRWNPLSNNGVSNSLMDRQIVMAVVGQLWREWNGWVFCDHCYLKSDHVLVQLFPLFLSPTLYSHIITVIYWERHAQYSKLEYLK